MDLNPYESPTTPPEQPTGPSLLVRHLSMTRVVDLLVVIAIIGVLIWLLLPAVSSSRHRHRPRNVQNLQFAP